MKKSVVVAIVSILLSSCIKKKTEPAVDDTNQYSVEGKITGGVAQWDAYGVKYTTNLNTVTVSINNTNYSTVTDANGNYTLTNVLPGTYNISYAKPGCGTIQKQQVTFAGNGTYYQNYSICDKPTEAFISATATVNMGILNITASMTPAPKIIACMVLTSTSNPNPDISDPNSYSAMNTFGILANTSNVQGSVLVNTYASGTIIYCKLYTFPYAVDGCNYFSYEYGKSVYVANGPGLPTFSVVMP